MFLFSLVSFLSYECELLCGVFQTRFDTITEIDPHDLEFHPRPFKVDVRISFSILLGEYLRLGFLLCALALGLASVFPSYNTI